MNNTFKNNMSNGGKIPVSKWWTNGTYKQKMMYAVGVTTLTITIISTVFIVVKSIARVESKKEVSVNYDKDRKESNYLT